MWRDVCNEDPTKDGAYKVLAGNKTIAEAVARAYKLKQGENFNPSPPEVIALTGTTYNGKFGKFCKTFKWEEKAGADGYEFIVEQERRVVQTKEVKENHCTICRESAAIVYIKVRSKSRGWKSRPSHPLGPLNTTEPDGDEIRGYSRLYKQGMLDLQEIEETERKNAAPDSCVEQNSTAAATPGWAWAIITAVITAVILAICGLLFKYRQQLLGIVRQWF